ncbi:MAG: tRNA (adenosine(37)-N6)-threonylcarbamoyltransferase complex transferase subunit TsaD [Firmicutes bacterium]|nr:tRNA (adenosine(37)-N6)-threonylcarbamoyltransferase complex transferase subunit TsaD [Bacillota bacterium]
MKRLVLAIETSCDETATAVVSVDMEILSNVVLSQIPIHSKYGGVVPEIASRNHIKVIDQVVQKALDDAKVLMSDISAVAATTHPGLPGAVLIGRIFGEALALRNNVPFISINHIHGHIASVPLSMGESELEKHIALVISGGHTSLYKVAKSGKVVLLEQTLDDAIGEAFDKVARVLGLSYPGGPEIEKQANKWIGNDELIKFVAKPNYQIQGFSYSGLKTAVLNYVNKIKMKGEEINLPHLAASFQYEAISQLVFKVNRILKSTKVKTLCVSGGVSANEYLRKTLTEECSKLGVKVSFPHKSLCGDNAAMIAAASILELK